jgi:hypothetical protein
MSNVFSVNSSIFSIWRKPGEGPDRGQPSSTWKAIALGMLFGASLVAMPGAHTSHRELAHGLRLAARLLTEPQGKAPLLAPELGFVGREPTRLPTVSANLM